MVRILLYGILFYIIVKLLKGNSSHKKEQFMPKNDIKQPKESNKKVKSDVGEYVDYEEVKD